jgi:AcrR family transcriptional regulator
MRSARTKQLIIEAYLALAREHSPQIPTAAQIADRAGYSVRSVFERFPDIHSLQLAAVDHALSLLAPPPPSVDGDRQTRIRSHVELRARTCDRWLPLWRSLVVNQNTSVELRRHVIKLRERAIERLETIYAPELSTLAAAERRHMLIVLEALLDAESWARMQEFFGLSYDEACIAWTQTIDRLLPPTPASP